MGSRLSKGGAHTHHSDTYKGIQSSQSNLVVPSTERNNMDAMKMSYELLRTITNDFSEDQLLGSGSFGIVYKGVHANKEIAVKVLRVMTGLEDEDFTNEFQNLSRLKHQNIVQLVGYCNESEAQIVEREDGANVTADTMHLALCFEYVDNGSLSRHITNENEGLDWHTRYKIIKGICEGLKHLREGLETPIWHLDLKPDNILLDKEMTPKIADFGLSRLIGDERTRMTMRSIGTCGYWPPEYVRWQLFSSAFDIFSLGVIIAKIMVGTEGYNSCADMLPRQLVNHVYNNWREKLQETVKPGSLDVYCEQVKACIKIASKCLGESRKQRPKIQEILVTLNDTETKIHACIDIKQSNDEESLVPSNGSVTPMSTSEGDYEGATSSYMNRPKHLSYKLLREITNDFSEDRQLGKGWFGTVYKGVLQDGQVIAVKVLGQNFALHNDKQFQTVIEEYAKVDHENVMPLFGYCKETEPELVQKNNGKYVLAKQGKLVLCFNYLTNGSLEQHILNNLGGLDWYTCHKIIKGICDGLKYLHERLPRPILHMNLKPSNILLDENMVPRITEFGMSQLIGEIETRRTISAFGTMGDLPPEFITKQIVTQQFDIHSLGVIILKMIAGTKSAYSISCSMTSRRFIDFVLQLWKTRLQESVDSRSVEGYCQQVRRCTEIALKCVEADRHKRPTIGDVVSTLQETEALILDNSGRMLAVDPVQLCFHFNQRKHFFCSSVQLHNNEDDSVAFRLVSKLPGNYLKQPPHGIVSPRCTYTLILPTQDDEPHWGHEGYVLQIVAVSYHQELKLQCHDQALSVVETFESHFNKALETAGDEVQEVPLNHVIVQLDEEASFEIINSNNSQQVSSIDVHPIKQWIMTTHLGDGYLRIWDDQKIEVLMYFGVKKKPGLASHLLQHDPTVMHNGNPTVAVYVAKFITREGWIVAGDGDGYIHVYSYDDKDTTSIKGHHGRIMSLAVHPMDPYVLSSSHDDCHLIKLWRWDQYCDQLDNSWECIRTFKGHSGEVPQVIFNPEDFCSFASASSDGTVKIWDHNSDVCDPTTFPKHPDGLLFVDYIIGDYPYLVTGSKDGTAQIWDMKTKRCIEYLIGHAHHVSVVYSHPEPRKLITGSLDGTVRIWDSTTYRLEKIIAFNLGAVYSFGYIDKLQRFIVGCNKGMAMIEIKFLLAL